MDRRSGMQNRWSQTHVRQRKIGRDILATEFFLEERGVPVPHQDPQPGVPVPGREGPITSGWLWMSEIEAFGDPGISLNEPVHRLTQNHLLWVLMLGQKLERHQGCMGRDWRVWHQGESWRGSFPPNRSTGRGHRFLAEHYHPWSQKTGTIWVSINGANTLCPICWFPETPSHPTWAPTQADSSGFSIWTACLGSCFSLS